jgi:PGF-pre-PGF domain-containing protein
LITPTNADSLTKTVSVTVSAQTTTTTLSGGGGDGGGGGGNQTTGKKKSQTWTKITPGKAEIMHVDDPDIGLKMINITVRNPAQTVTITITKLTGKPASVVHEISGKVYKYIEITPSNIPDDNVDKAKIQFQVNKSWISNNKINRTTIALSRYKNNNWEKLTTKEISEDNDYVYYEAETPGFSTFAVTGEEILTTTIPATTIATTTITTMVTTTIPSMTTGVGGVPTWILIIIILVVVIIIAVWLYQRRSSTGQVL